MIIFNKKGIEMAIKKTEDIIEKLQILLRDTVNLSITNEDVLIHRNKIGLSDEHLITLVQIITYKLHNIDREFNELVDRIKY